MGDFRDVAKATVSAYNTSNQTNWSEQVSGRVTKQTTGTESIRWGITVVISVILCCGLYCGSQWKGTVCCCQNQLCTRICVRAMIGLLKSHFCFADEVEKKFWHPFLVIFWDHWGPEKGYLTIWELDYVCTTGSVATKNLGGSFWMISMMLMIINAPFFC